MPPPPVNLYIADQQSAYIGGDDSAQKIGAAIPVLPARVDDLQPFPRAGDHIISRHQLPLPDACQEALLNLIYDAPFERSYRLT